MKNKDKIKALRSKVESGGSALKKSLEAEKNAKDRANDVKEIRKQNHDTEQELYKHEAAQMRSIAKALREAAKPGFVLGEDDEITVMVKVKSKSTLERINKASKNEPDVDQGEEGNALIISFDPKDAENRNDLAKFVVPLCERNVTRKIKQHSARLKFLKGETAVAVERPDSLFVHLGDDDDDAA